MSVGRIAKPAPLRIVEGRGTRKDGQQTDSGGRVVKDGPGFTREAPPRPDTLSPDAAWLWDQVVDQMETLGLLKPLDGPALEIACETFARWRAAVRMRNGDDGGMLAVNSQGLVTAPWVGIEERAATSFRQWAAEFGFTPAAEKALAGGGSDDSGGDDNPF